MSTIIIQARENSSRLPGKVLLPLNGKEMLLQIVARCEAAADVIVATSIDDKNIISLCKLNGIRYYAGSPDDVLDRYIKAAEHYNLKDDNLIVRITADCPCVQPGLILKMIREHRPEYDITCNVFPPTYPDGYDIEIFPLKTLYKCREWSEIYGEKAFREHATMACYGVDRFNINNIISTSGDYSLYRLTVDYQADYDRIKKLYADLGDKFNLSDVYDYISDKPEYLAPRRNETCQIVKH
jgi:spore coat polysaccharide biosynthesis protein SpsF